MVEKIVIVAMVVVAFALAPPLGIILAVCAVFALLKGRGRDPPPPPPRQRCPICGGDGWVKDSNGWVKHDCPAADVRQTHPDLYP